MSRSQWAQMGQVSVNEAIWYLALACGFSSIVLAPVYIKRTTSPDLSWAFARDPKVGTPSPVPLENNRRTLLVFAGDCSSCGVTAFNPKDVRLPSSSAVVVAASGTPSAMPKALTSVGVRVTTVAPNVVQSLNPVWTPRWYWYDEAGHLRDLQRSPTDMQVDP